MTVSAHIFSNPITVISFLLRFQFSLKCYDCYWNVMIVISKFVVYLLLYLLNLFTIIMLLNMCCFVAVFVCYIIK